MATITTHDDRVEVRFTLGEKISGLVGDQQIPRAAITGVSLVEDPIAAVKGLRAPGLAIPGRRKVGTWRGVGRKELVCVRAGEPAVRLELTGQRYDAALIGMPDAAAVVARLS